jgi:polyisoprenoid-binding protein YceI
MGIINVHGRFADAQVRLNLISASIRRGDWGLTWNLPLEGGGWLVSEEVTINIDLQAVRSESHVAPEALHAIP